MGAARQNCQRKCTAAFLPCRIPRKLASTRGLGPPPINPIRVQATSTQEEEAVLAAMKEAAKLITNKIKLDRGLKGQIPDSFDRDQTKVQSFMNVFDLFWMTNDDASMMTNPYKQSTYFLGLINGPQVEDWVQDQANGLQEKTTRH